MTSARELLQQVKKEIRETEPVAVEPLLGQVLLLDVREPDEYEQGAIPGAVHIPRGYLETQVEGRITDHHQPIVVYCAGGVRSAYAAKTLGDLGYDDVVSMAGGFNRWKDEGREWKAPIVLNADQRNRYQRHLLLPEIGESGQQKLLGSKVLMLGAGGLGSPAALYLAAAGVGAIGIVDMDVVDASNLQRQILHNMDRIGDRKVDSAKKTLAAMNPDLDVRTYDVRLGADNIVDLFKEYDLVVDGTRQLPDPLPGERRVAAHEDAGRARLDLPIRGSGHCVRSLRRPLLPMHRPRAPATGARAVVRGGRCARRALRHHRLARGCRSREDAAGYRQPARRPLLAYDALEEEFRQFKVRRDPNCPACGEGAEIVIAEYDQLCMPHATRPAA